jgi:DNA modification methylase
MREPEAMTATVHVGDCREVMRGIDADSVDAIVTDPPYHLTTGRKGGSGPASVNLQSPHGRARVTTGFMGKAWDGGDIAHDPEVWIAALRLAKPGAYLLAFGGTRTFHRLTCAIEDAGWEIRDCVMWVYGSGFPKSLDVSKAIDKHGGKPVAWFGPWFRQWREANGITQKQVAALFPSKSGGLTGCVANWELGFNMPTPEQFNLIRDTFALPFDTIEAAEREVIDMRAPGQRAWQGWGTALKPAWEPIILARKPLQGTVAANVLKHGTGALNIDGCRVEAEPDMQGSKCIGTHALGRWPANVIHDGSDEVVALFPAEAGASAPVRGTEPTANVFSGAVEFSGMRARVNCESSFRGDSGSAARFFYTAKADRADRDEGLHHRAKKPLLWSSGEQSPGTFQSPNTNRNVRNSHPTVKPVDLMRYLCRLVTPPGGTVLDPFCGSGSTGKAALLEGFGFIGIENDQDYAAIARDRIYAAAPLFANLEPAAD